MRQKENIDFINKKTQEISQMFKLERYFLYKLASHVKGKVFVEIGSYLGASAICICEGIKQSGIKDQRLYCVDRWEDYKDMDIKDSFYDKFLDNTQEYREHITVLKGNSADQAKYFFDEQIAIDFLFIDGDHEYEAVKADWKAFSPLLNPSAIVVVHDLRMRTGVKRFCEEHLVPYKDPLSSLPNMYVGRIKNKSWQRKTRK